MMNIRNVNASLLKIDKKSCKSIGIYYIGYVTKKDFKYVNIHSANPLSFVVDKVNGFIEEKEGSKYLNFGFTYNNSEVLKKKYAELWNGIKNLIEKIYDKPGEY